jgi:hypothetical protein
MRASKLLCAALAGSLGLAPLTGCENLPGSKKEQGAVIGGVGGAVAGAALAKENRLLGALIGGALGAGGGYLIGSQLSKADPDHRQEAVEAGRRARQDPARAVDVQRANTADLNNDGFVTLDEVVAMQKAGLSDQEMIRRLEATGQFFDLNNEQEDYLRDQGVGRRVISSMRDMNADVRREAERRAERRERVGRDY